MALNFVTPSAYAGGSIFKPADHMQDLALLIEPKSVAHDQPNTYQGKTTYRTEVTSDITVFKNSEALEKGQPEILKSVRVVHPMLTDTLEKILATGPNNAAVSILAKVPTKNGSGYVFRDVPGDRLELVIKWSADQDAAIAAAVEDAPDF